MSSVTFTAMPIADAEALWNGAADAYGRLPETMISDGPGYPCRHCLDNIDAGDALLVFAYRPFPELQPYAETGPIFLHKTPCERYKAEEVMPPVIAGKRDFIVRGYGNDDRIVYGTGAVKPTPDITAYAAELLGRDDIAYVHVRSASNNCYLCRLDQG